jgi:hypothetical protein
MLKVPKVNCRVVMNPGARTDIINAFASIKSKTIDKGIRLMFVRLLRHPNQLVEAHQMTCRSSEGPSQ